MKFLLVLVIIAVLNLTPIFGLSSSNNNETTVAAQTTTQSNKECKKKNNEVYKLKFFKISLILSWFRIWWIRHISIKFENKMDARYK